MSTKRRKTKEQKIQSQENENAFTENFDKDKNKQNIINEENASKIQLTNKEELEHKSDETNTPKVQLLTEEIEGLKEEKLRLLAEMENLRKRSDRDRLESIKYGSINLARDILSPEDNLSRALEAITTDENKTNSINNLVDGLKIILKEFSTILEKHGVKKIEALNKKFDHNLHQAMLEIENDEVKEGTVLQEIQSGFTMYGRLLRPTMVGVSKKSTSDKEEEKA